MAAVQAGIRIGSVAGGIPIPAEPNQPEKAKPHPQGLLVVLELESFSLAAFAAILTAAFAVPDGLGLSFGPWNDTCSRVTDNARLMFAVSCPCSVQLAGI